MTLIKNSTKLSDIILLDHTTITVLDRFNISLGVGDATVEHACRDHGIDTGFFVTIINTFIHEDYFPEQTLLSFSPAEIIDYLTKTNNYYSTQVIPNIARHFKLLISKTTSTNNNLLLMQQFFEEVQAELMQRIAADRDRWFPSILASERLTSHARTETPQTDGADLIEDKIDDLINMLVMHLRGDYDHNLCNAVITAIFALKKDIKQNNRIRYRILMPISDALLTPAP